MLAMGNSMQKKRIFLLYKGVIIKAIGKNTYFLKIYSYYLYAMLGIILFKK